MSYNNILFRLSSPVIFMLIVFISLFQCNSESSGNRTAGAVIEQKYDFTSVDKLINKSINDEAFPGAVLLVGNSDSILYKKAFGRYTYHKNSTQVSLSTIFDVASLTKVIATTTAVMLLFDKQQINLNDKVSKFLPGFAESGKENVTILNLLRHNSGLPAWKKFYPEITNKHELINEIYKTKLEFKPGMKTLYSDLGFITLGIIIEKITGTSLDEFCNNKIFKPLKMESTFFNPADTLANYITPTEFDNYWRKRLLQGEVHDETASIMNGVAGHAGLFSTAEDIYRLVSVLLEGQMGEGEHFISSKTISEFVTGTGSPGSRLLGWDLKSESGSSAGKYLSKNSFGHTGFTGTSVWCDPEKNLIVVFLTNRVYPSRENKKLNKIRPLLHDLIYNVISQN